MENRQVAVFLSYASPAGHALIDRELYLPRSWTSDKARCAAAGIPAKTAFATKPKLARVMIARALDAGTPAAWVTGDEVYGADPGLRTDLEARRIGYVLAVAASHPGRQGPPLLRLGLGGHRPGRPGHRWLLVRRNRTTKKLAFYRCYAPRRKLPGRQGIDGAGRAPGPPLGSWYRWTTLAMLALAFLTIAAVTEHTRPPPGDQIPLTRNEIAALFSTLIIEPVTDPRHRMRWSAWRRRHQRRARTCHYRRQAASDP